MTGGCSDIKLLAPCLKIGHFARAIPAPELAIGLARFAVIALQVSPSLCLVLPPLPPTGADPEDTPRSAS